MDIVECRSDSEFAERPLALTWKDAVMRLRKSSPAGEAPTKKAFASRQRMARLLS